MPTPTSAMTKKGAAANFVWGLPSGINITTYGRVQTFGDDRASDKEPLPNADGETDGIVYYNHRNEGTLEAIIKANDFPTVEIADTVSITTAGSTATVYLIEGVKKNWTAGAWAKITLTLCKYQMLDVTPAQTPSGT